MRTWNSSARAADFDGDAHVHALRELKGEKTRMWRAMLPWEAADPLPVDAFFGAVVLEEKDHFVGRPLHFDLRIESAQRLIDRVPRAPQFAIERTPPVLEVREDPTGLLPRPVQEPIGSCEGPFGPFLGIVLDNVGGLTRLLQSVVRQAPDFVRPALGVLFDPIGVGPRFREHPLDLFVGLQTKPLDLVVKGLRDLGHMIRYGGVAGLARRLFGSRFRPLPGAHVDFQRVEVPIDLDPVVAPSHHSEGRAIGLIVAHVSRRPWGLEGICHSQGTVADVAFSAYPDKGPKPNCTRDPAVDRTSQSPNRGAETAEHPIERYPGTRSMRA